MNYKKLPKGTYVVAVSGGIDSVVLLDILSKQKDLKLVISHFDHGMRATSHNDAEFVKNLAQKYSLPFELGWAKLGDVGEAEAREARYAFLRNVKKKYNAKAIVVAHHSDDIIETIIINMLRGTGWKGLSSLRSSGDILRPLLDVSKADVREYAKKHEIQWVEDETNIDEKYLRNRVRHNILSKMSEEKKQQFLDLYNSQLKLHEEISKHSADMQTEHRHNYIMWPENVAIEVLRSQFELTRPQAKRALHAIKTAQPGTVFELSAGKSLVFTDKKVTLMLK